MEWGFITAFIDPLGASGLETLNAKNENVFTQSVTPEIYSHLL